jgi:hypothetical protein
MIICIKLHTIIIIFNNLTGVGELQWTVCLESGHDDGNNNNNNNDDDKSPCA